MGMTARRTLRLLNCDKGVAALEFVFLAPALLALVFGTMIYSIYFVASIGVRQAAAEGARAAVAGLSLTERQGLAQTRAAEVIETYRSVLGNTAQPKIVADAGDVIGTFKVTVSYDMTKSAIMRYGNFVPLPSKELTASVIVTNGGY